MSNRSLWVCFLTAVVISCIVGINGIHLRSDLAESQHRLSLTQVALRQVKADQAGLLSTLFALPLSDPLLKGVDLDGKQNSVTGNRPVVVYVVDPGCPSCALNLPGLNSLADQYPGQVIGFGDGTPDDLRTYAHAMSIRFPLVIPSEGSLFYALPRHSTPVLAAVSNGKINLLLNGKVDSLGWQTIHRTLRP